MPLALIAFALVSLVHLASLVVASESVVGDVTQIMLMPLLAAVLLTSAPRPYGRVVRLAAWALGFSWLGDTLPRFARDQPLPELFAIEGFGLMVGGFALAQATYVAAFWPYRSRSALRSRTAVVIAAVTLAGLIAVIAPNAGWVTLPVAAYAVLLVGMALLAPGLGRAGAWGGALFVFSDALIGLRAFSGWEALDFALGGFVVMVTYIAGQSLLTRAVLQRDAADRAPDRVLSGERVTT